MFVQTTKAMEEVVPVTIGAIAGPIAGPAMIGTRLWLTGVLHILG